MTNQQYLMKKTGTAKMLAKDLKENTNDKDVIKIMLDNVRAEIVRLKQENVSFDSIDVLEYHAELTVEKAKIEDKLEALYVESSISPEMDYDKDIRETEAILDNINMALLSLEQLM